MKSSISQWWDRWRGFHKPVLHRHGDRRFGFYIHASKKITVKASDVEYFMLATIRGFASESLQASDEEPELRR